MSKKKVYLIISIIVLFQTLVFRVFYPGSISGSDSLIPSTTHAIYIAVVEINHKNLTSNAEVVIKVFTNDLDDALFNAYKTHAKLESEDNCMANSLLLEKYFSSHFRCLINKKNRPMHLKSCEKNDNSLWLRFDMTCPVKWRDLKLSADFLMELFPTQSNVISVFHGDKKNYFRLTNSEKSRQIRFVD